MFEKRSPKRHSIGTIVRELQEINNEHLADRAVGEVCQIIEDSEEFCTRHEQILNSIHQMRDMGYAHVDEEERLDEIEEVNLINIRQMFLDSVPILNLLRSLVGEDRLGNVLMDDDSIEEAFRLLGNNFN